MTTRLPCPAVPLSERIIYITHRRLTPCQIIQPQKGKHFQVMHRACPFVYILRPYPAARIARQHT